MVGAGCWQRERKREKERERERERGSTAENVASQLFGML
jgi:hypothetical protein